MQYISIDFFFPQRWRGIRGSAETATSPTPEPNLSQRSPVYAAVARSKRREDTRGRSLTYPTAEISFSCGLQRRTKIIKVWRL